MPYCGMGILSSQGTGSGDSLMVVMRHKFSDRKDDLYQSPPEAVTALLRAEKIPPVIWEPACGPGAIARVLRAAGHVVYATDLVDYDSPDQDESAWDFLMETQLPIGVEAIITNPPYKLAADFVRHGLKLCPKIMMLLRLSFIESSGRSDILDGGALARVYVFSERLPMMHREGWEGSKSTNTVPFAWFVWDANHAGPTILNRISWRSGC